MKLRLEITLDYDADLMCGDDDDAKRWFFDEVLCVGRQRPKDDLLLLHSNEIGDTVGEVTVVRVIGDAP